MDRPQLEKAVAELLEELPPEIKRHIENVEIVIEDWPDPSLLGKFRRRPPLVLGLYHGVPISRRGPRYGNVLPDRIIIYQKVIESLCSDEECFLSTLRKVVLHEIGHYFGLDDFTLRRLGY